METRGKPRIWDVHDFLNDFEIVLGEEYPASATETLRKSNRRDSYCAYLSVQDPAPHYWSHQPWRYVLKYMYRVSDCKSTLLQALQRAYPCARYRHDLRMHIAPFTDWIKFESTERSKRMRAPVGTERSSSPLLDFFTTAGKLSVHSKLWPITVSNFDFISACSTVTFLTEVPNSIRFSLIKVTS